MAHTAGCLLLLVSALTACELPLPTEHPNPLLGSWQLTSAPGVGWHGHHSVTFEPDSMVVDRGKRIGVQHYEITRTKVRLRTDEGEDYIYSVYDVGRICQDPPPEQLYLAFPGFDQGRQRPQACYVRTAGPKQS